MSHDIVTSTKSNSLRISADDPDSIRPPKLFRTKEVKFSYKQNIFLANTAITGANSLWAWLSMLPHSTARMLAQFYVEWVDSDGNGYALTRESDRRLCLTGGRQSRHILGFSTESIFLGQNSGDARQGHQLFFRTHNGKVLLDISQPAPRYRLSVRRDQRQSEQWTTIKPYLELVGNEEAEKELKEDLGDAMHEKDL